MVEDNAPNKHEYDQLLENLWIVLWSGSGASGDNFNSGIYYSLVHVCTVPLKKKHLATEFY